MILVTGSRGFLGTHLLAELKRSGSGQIKTLTRRDCDLLDHLAVQRTLDRVKPSVIYHLAGSTKPLGPDALWDANVTATINLLEAVLRLPNASKIPIIICGSAGEYGAVGRAAVVETAPTAPVTIYGSVKLSQTLAALSYGNQGLDVRVVRVFNAIGPGMPEHLALGAFLKQLRLIKEGKQSPVLATGRLTSQRDFLDSRDLARALVAVARRGQRGEIYNAASGRSVSVGVLLRRTIALSGLKVTLTLDRARLRGADIPRIVGSHAKLTRQTGWRPRLSLDQSLRDCLAWKA